MFENLDRVVFISLSIILLSLGFSIVFKTVDSTSDLISIYEKKAQTSNLVYSASERENIISKQRAKALVGQLILLVNREKIGEQYIYLDGKLIDLTRHMEIPKLYIGNSNEEVDLRNSVPLLNKSTYELSYGYSEDLEINAYILK